MSEQNFVIDIDKKYDYTFQTLTYFLNVACPLKKGKLVFNRNKNTNSINNRFLVFRNNIKIFTTKYITPQKRSDNKLSQNKLRVLLI